jgi:beta-aspartyl-peptidase (threonine type)
VTLQQACDEVIHNRLLKIGGDGGLIAVDSNGNVCLPFNTAGMYRGIARQGEPIELSIYGD